MLIKFNDMLISFAISEMAGGTDRGGAPKKSLTLESFQLDFSGHYVTFVLYRSLMTHFICFAVLLLQLNLSIVSSS